MSNTPATEPSDPSVAKTDDEQRAALQAHFSNVPLDKHNDFWDQAWQRQTTPWDRQTHHPALEETLQQRADLLGSPLTSAGKRRTALVPGCGKGYDVLLLASFGFDAYGVDVSDTAVQAGEQVRANADRLYPVRDNATGRGAVKVLRYDFFAGDFNALVEGGQFDLIFDYTFLCALSPPMRPKWAAQMTRLLSPSGNLVCVEFPLEKPMSAPGPPHGLSKELYEELLQHPGQEVQYLDDRTVNTSRTTEPGAEALSRTVRFTPTRTHPGQVSSVSIWRH